ncbi:MAG: hypothetical protein AB1941_26515 [Gemmatimonadota bacterium]
MAYRYLFFRPARLPLTPEELSADTVLELDDGAEVRASLDRALPGIAWTGDGQGRTDVNGQWMEFFYAPGEGTLSLRCSLRADYGPIVQRLCDATGWIAFDERPRCYQPHRPPMPA